MGCVRRSRQAATLAIGGNRTVVIGPIASAVAPIASAAFTSGAVIADTAKTDPGTLINQYLILAGIVVTFITAVLGYMRTRHKLADIHVLVNSQLTNVIQKLSTSIERQDQLHDTLVRAGVDVPPKPAQIEGSDDDGSER